MEKSIFEHSNVFRFHEKVDYSPEGIISKRVIDRPVGTVTLFSFDEGQRLSTHSAPYDAMVQVIEGTVEITINDQPFTLVGGETIIMPAGIPHALLAKEKFKMVLTMIKG
ncbi:MAG TPA: cupin domain-containing protein [Bacteroidales bacterium]|mgnify:CR=1 FL=1|nr:cupin domain-containing protein [Bacteroidales bacterium]HPS62911.1 cupin domain-containing protein [Bacteroidales bacterium]